MNEVAGDDDKAGEVVREQLVESLFHLPVASVRVVEVGDVDESHAGFRVLPCPPGPL
jgi:hypothetical protein